MGDGFFVRSTPIWTAWPAPLGSNELATSSKLGASATRPGRAGHAAARTTPLAAGAPLAPVLPSSSHPRSAATGSAPTGASRSRISRSDPPPLEVGVPPARRHPPEPRRPEVLLRPPAVGREPVARYQPASVRVFLERPECGTSAARRLEPVGVDELELVGSGDIHQRLAHRRVSVESFSRSPSSYWCTRAAASRPSRC
jgi:hypothetical protein